VREPVGHGKRPEVCWPSVVGPSLVFYTSVVDDEDCCDSIDLPPSPLYESFDPCGMPPSATALQASTLDDATPPRSTLQLHRQGRSELPVQLHEFRIHGPVRVAGPLGHSLLKIRDSSVVCKGTRIDDIRAYAVLALATRP
jgi:hypothetical protein